MLQLLPSDNNAARDTLNVVQFDKMAVDVGLIVRAPQVNPVTRKALSIPFLNPINMYGRVFFFSWFGFFVAFWSWYAFPPLVSNTLES